MVEDIQTDQDRLDVIGELQEFITLERDIDAFVETFGEWIETKG